MRTLESSGIRYSRLTVAVIALTVAVVAAAWLAVPASATRAAKPAIVSCGRVTGASWVFPGSGGKLTGKTYGVTAVKATCAFAKKWAIKLSGAKLAE